MSVSSIILCLLHMVLLIRTKKLYSSSILLSSCSRSVFFCSSERRVRKCFVNWFVWFSFFKVMPRMCIVLCSNVSAWSSSFILLSSKFRGTSAMSPSFMVGKSSSGLQKAVIVIECAYFIVFCVDGKVYKKFRVLLFYEAFVVCYVFLGGFVCCCSIDWSCCY